MSPLNFLASQRNGKVRSQNFKYILMQNTWVRASIEVHDCLELMMISPIFTEHLSRELRKNRLFQM